MRYLKWIAARLDHPRAGRAVIAVAFLLALPSLFSPLVADDCAHALKWRDRLTPIKEATSGSLLDDYFVFANGSAAEYQHKVADGHYVWWTAPDFKVAFWRPIAAATHLIDHALWPGNAVLMHLHTLLWFLGMLIALHALYRRFLVPSVANLALAIYAWDDARGMVLSWVANRNALIAALGGLSAIIAHDRWRRDGWWPGAWLGPMLLALALLSAEMAIATTGFLLAYALCLDQGTPARRLARLLPCLIVVVVWQAVYIRQGFGVQAPALYLDPLRAPLSYARGVIERAPVLLLAQLSPLSADLWLLYPPRAKLAVFLVAVTSLIVATRVVWPRLANEQKARFWILGAGLALLPICAALPSDRLLVFVGVGVAPVLATLFAKLVNGCPSSSPRHSARLGPVDRDPAEPNPAGTTSASVGAGASAGARWTRVVIGTLGLFNLAVAPMLLPIKCLTTLAMNSMSARADRSIPSDSAVSRKALVVVWDGTGGASLGFLRKHREAEGIPSPSTWQILALSFGDVSVTRLDEVTLRLSPTDGFFASEMHQMVRDPSHPFRQGDVVRASNMTVTVTEIMPNGRPQTVEFRFAASLESPKWLWMRGVGTGLVSWTPPKVGQTIMVPAAFQ